MYAGCRDPYIIRIQAERWSRPLPPRRMVPCAHPRRRILPFTDSLSVSAGAGDSVPHVEDHIRIASEWRKVSDYELWIGQRYNNWDWEGIQQHIYPCLPCQRLDPIYMSIVDPTDSTLDSYLRTSTTTHRAYPLSSHDNDTLWRLRMET